MALTAATKTELYQFFAIAFDAAPGVTYMNQLAEAVNAGMTVKQIVEVFTTKPQFTSVYPDFYTNEQFATKLIANVVGDSASDAAKAEAVADVEAALTAGWSRGKVIYQIFSNLAAKDHADATWGNTAQLMANQVAVAQYVTEEQLLDTTDLAQLQATIANVTPTSDVSTPAAIEAVIGAGSGQTFALTTGLDNIAGTAGNDTINAFPVSSGLQPQATTLNSADVIDGGAGTDTLNIFTAEDWTGFGGIWGNSMQQGAVKNVEIININNSGVGTPFGAVAGSVDASKFEGATEVWQKNIEFNLVNLASTTTAGFRGDMIGQALAVQAASVATSATVAFDGVDESATLAVGVDAAATDAKLNTVNVVGTRKDGVADANSTVGALALAVTVGDDVQSLTLKTATDVVLTANANGKAINTVDASGSTGGVTYTTAANTVSTIKTGAGKDTVTVVTATEKDTPATISALVETNAGDDVVNVNTTLDGSTTVKTGEGDDTVNVITRSDKLVVEMGAGKDSFTSAVAITAADSIDAGEGVDTLALKLVGSVNVGAFKGFDVFDVAGMNANLDLDILNANNTVTEIVGSAALAGAVTLQNVTTDFRATGDMGATTLTIAQKTAGALTVTLDADETGVADAADDVAAVSVKAEAATSVSAVFDTAYLAAAGAVTGETAATDNVSTIALATQAAASISVVSGGAFSKNVLNVTEGAGTDALTSVTVTGDRALTLGVTGASKLATVDASAATGGLTASLAQVKDGGSIKLGSGVDTITVTDASTTGGVESIVGFEKAAAAAVGTDATAKAAAIADADTLVLAGATVAGAVLVAGGEVNAKGVLTFTGAGPATLDAAIAIADLAADATKALVFEYIGNSYVFVDGATDTLVKLTGVTGVTNFAADAGEFFIV